MTEGVPRVLVIGVDGAVRALLDDLLRMEGYAVECSQDELAGAQRLAAGGFDLVLLDLARWDVDAIAVLRELRERVARGLPPALVLTTNAERPNRAAIRAAGAADVVIKPFDMDELIECVGAVTRSARCAV